MSTFPRACVRVSSFASAIVFNGAGVMFGGRSASGALLSDAWLYDPIGKLWIEVRKSTLNVNTTH